MHSLKHFRYCRSRYVAMDNLRHNSPGNRSREVFKPSKYVESILGSTEKI